MSRASPNPDLVREIYIDESSQTKNRYLVMGGAIFHQPRLTRALDALQAARLPELPENEIKWGKVSKLKLPAYIRFVDAFWDHEDLKHCHFHSLFVDTSQFDHKKWNGGDREVGFCKEVYQLALKFGKLYPDFFHLYLDARNSNQTPDELRLILNRGIAKNGDRRDWPYRRCHYRDSKRSLALQMVDIFIGAIGFCINGHIDAEDASPAKRELATHIMNRANIRNPAGGTGRTGKFTIWQRQLKK